MLSTIQLYITQMILFNLDDLDNYNLKYETTLASVQTGNQNTYLLCVSLACTEAFVLSAVVTHTGL